MKHRKVMAAALLFLILLCGFKISAQKGQWLSYEPAIVEVEGKLTVVSKYGPPNFGENPKTDAKIRVPVLVLREPISVHANAQNFPYNVQVRGVRRIQLDVSNLKEPYVQFIGKRVIARGTLFHGHTGGHYTELVLDTQSIRLQANSKR